MSAVAETAATKQNPFVPSPWTQDRRQSQISLEAHVVMWLSSRQQNVSTCNLCLLDQGPLPPGWNGRDRSNLKNGLSKVAERLSVWVPKWLRKIDILRSATFG